jgi:hypothetical protein
VSTLRRSLHGIHGWAAGFVLLTLCMSSGAQADPPAAGTPGDAAAPASGTVAESKDGFFSSLKQAFAEDTSREVVRGHFDSGTAPNGHRYYCLVDPKSGKKEPNGVSGDPYKRHDGMTGIKNAAVTPLSCTDAEQKGMLVTTDYVLLGRAAASAPTVAAAPPSPPPAPLAPPLAAATVPPAVPTPMSPVPAPGPAVPAPAAPAAAAGLADSTTSGEVLATFNRFIAAENAHDRSALAATLLNSKDFVWAQSRGSSVWGYREALDAFAEEWKGTRRVDPQLQELRIGALSTDSAVLITPLLLTEGPTTLPVRWSGVFVKTKAGWLIGSIVVTPFTDWRPSAR